MLNLILFFFSPFICFIKSIYDFIKGSNQSLYVFSLCMGTLAYLTAPASDLYPHYIIYTSFYNAPFSSLHNVEKDFLIPLIDYIFVNNGINYEWIRFFICTFQYCTLVYIFNDLTRGYQQRTKARLFLILILYSGFFGFVGVRSPLASSFYFLGVFFIFRKNKNLKGYFFFALACISHFFLISVIIFTIIIKYLKIRHISNLKFCVTIIICYLVGASLSEFYVTKFFPEQMIYINGYWGNAYVYTLKGYLFSIIMKFSSIPLIYFFLKHNDGDESYRNILLFLICCLALTFSFNTISSRFLPLIKYLVLFFFIKNYNRCSSWMQKLILCVGIIFQASTLYTNRDFLISSNNNYIAFFKPAILTFQHTFSDSWIYKHIDSDGLFRNTSH